MKIRLPKFEEIMVSEKRTIIDEENRVYREGGQVVPFGSILLNALNEEMRLRKEADEIEQEGGIYPHIYGPFDGFNLKNPLPLNIVQEAIKKKVLSPELKTYVENYTETIPFTVTIYNDRPTLALKGSTEYLLLLDLLKIFQYNIKIRLCENCERAFIPSTQDRYCPLCKQDETLKKALTRHANAKRNKNPALKFQNKVRHRTEYRGPQSPYYMLISRRCPGNAKESLVREWVSVDREYQSIRRTYLYKDGGDENAWEAALDHAWKEIYTPDDLRQWLHKQTEVT